MEDYGREQAGGRRQRYLARHGKAAREEKLTRRRAKLRSASQYRQKVAAGAKAQLQGRASDPFAAPPANARSRIQQHAAAGLGQPKDSSVSFEEGLMRQAPPEKGLRLRGGR